MRENLKDRRCLKVRRVYILITVTSSTKLTEALSNNNYQESLEIVEYPFCQSICLSCLSHPENPVSKLMSEFLLRVTVLLMTCWFILNLNLTLHKIQLINQETE